MQNTITIEISLPKPLFDVIKTSAELNDVTIETQIQNSLEFCYSRISTGAAGGFARQIISAAGLLRGDGNG